MKCIQISVFLSAILLSQLTAYYGRPDLPIGLCPVDHTEHFDPFAPTLADTKRYPCDQTNATAPDGVSLYRRLLYDAPDNSVKVLVVGYATCAALLLQTEPNHNGDNIPLSGSDLVKAKVTGMVQMAGVRPGASDSFNLGHDAQAAVYVEDHWPTKIVYSNPGELIRAGAKLTDPACRFTSDRLDISTASPKAVHMTQAAKHVRRFNWPY